MTMCASIQPARFGSPRNASHVLLLAVLIATMQGLACGQASSGQPETVPPPSTTAHERSADNPSTSIQGRSDQVATSRCRLRVPDTLPSPKAGKAVTTNAPLPFTPLSTRCKFDLFLRTTYSPYTFASAGFQATLAQAQGQWPHYGGGMQGWGKRFGATLADTESRRFIQTFALSTILHQDPRYFASHKRALISRAWYAITRVAVTKNDKGDDTFNTSEFLGAYSPVRCKMPTTQPTTGVLGYHESLWWRPELGCGWESSTRIHAGHEASVPETCTGKIKKIEEKLPIPPEDKP
jgi:hypothetical protein